MSRDMGKRGMRVSSHKPCHWGTLQEWQVAAYALPTATTKFCSWDSKKKHNNPPGWTEWFIWKKISDPSTTYNINRINSGPAKGTITELGMQIGPSILCKTQTVQLLFTLNFITPREELGCICTHLYGHIPKKGSVTTHLSQNSNNFPLYLLL